MSTPFHKDARIDNSASQFDRAFCINGSAAELHPQFANAIVALCTQADRVVWAAFVQALFNGVDQIVFRCFHDGQVVRQVPCNPRVATVAAETADDGPVASGDAGAGTACEIKNSAGVSGGQFFNFGW